MSVLPNVMWLEFVLTNAVSYTSRVNHVDSRMGVHRDFCHILIGCDTPWHLVIFRFVSLRLVSRFTKINAWTPMETFYSALLEANAR